jgi:amidase
MRSLVLRARRFGTTAAALLAALCLGAAPASGSIAEIQASLASGETTCRAIVEDSLARVAASEQPGGINAVIETNPEALAIADGLDLQQSSGAPLGPLHCVPVLIKDNFQTADELQTTAGSLTLRGFHARRDAYVVARLRDAGAVIVGKANMNEWAQGVSGYSSRGGQTRNGLNPLRGPGGSSGGSAAAVAAGLVPLATGTDTGGSIQIPASYNGIVGLRSTKGLISRAGILPAAEVSDVAGPLVGSVDDLARVLGVMTGVDPRDPATEASESHFLPDYTPFLDPQGLQGARIGVLDGAFEASFRSKSPDVEQGFRQALETMRSEGATVVEGLPPLRSSRAGWQTFFTVVGPQFKAEINDWFAGPGRSARVDSLAEVIELSESRRIRPRVRILDVLEQSQDQPPPGGKKYRRAERRLALLREATTDFMAEHDLDALVYPATGCPPAPRGGVEDPTYSCGNRTAPLPFGANPSTIAPLLSPVTGLPVLSLPGAPLPGGLRTGISLLGPAWSEPALIRMGYAFEVAG